jgi:hypothetical protein
MCRLGCVIAWPFVSSPAHDVFFAEGPVDVGRAWAHCFGVFVDGNDVTCPIEMYDWLAI